MWTSLVSSSSLMALNTSYVLTPPRSIPPSWVSLSWVPGPCIQQPAGRPPSWMLLGILTWCIQNRLPIPPWKHFSCRLPLPGKTIPSLLHHSVRSTYKLFPTWVRPDTSTATCTTRAMSLSGLQSMSYLLSCVPLVSLQFIFSSNPNIPSEMWAGSCQPSASNPLLGPHLIWSPSQSCYLVCNGHMISTTTAPHFLPTAPSFPPQRHTGFLVSSPTPNRWSSQGLCPVPLPGTFVPK